MPFFLVAFFLLLPLPLFAANIVDLGQVALTEARAPVASIPIDLGRESSRGIEARGQLESQPSLDESAPLADNMRHFLLSVEFVEDQTGKTVSSGQVAARSFGPDNGVAQTVRLETLENSQWVGSLALKTKGETMIKIGSKLSDGKKRIYRFFYNTPKTDPSGEKPEVIPAE